MPNENNNSNQPGGAPGGRPQNQGGRGGNGRKRRPSNGSGQSPNRAHQRSGAQTGEGRGNSRPQPSRQSPSLPAPPDQPSAAFRVLRALWPIREGRNRTKNATITAAWITGGLAVAGGVAAAVAPDATEAAIRWVSPDGNTATQVSTTIIKTPMRGRRKSVSDDDQGAGIKARVAPNLYSPPVGPLYKDHQIVQIVCKTAGQQVTQDRPPYMVSDEWVKLEGDGGMVPVVFTALSQPIRRGVLDKLPLCHREEADTSR